MSGASNGAYASAIGNSGQAPGLMRARISGGRTASDSIAAWLVGYAQLASRHAAELEKHLAKHQLDETQLGTLTQAWHSVADIGLARAASLGELSRRVAGEVEAPVRKAVQWPSAERQLELLDQVPDDMAVVDRLQSLDEQRLQSLKDALTRLTTIEVDSGQQVIAAAEKAVQSLLAFDPAEDVQSYVAQVVSGIAPTDPGTTSGQSQGSGKRAGAAAKSSPGQLSHADNSNTSSAKAQSQAGSSNGHGVVGALKRAGTTRKASRVSLRDDSDVASVQSSQKKSGVSLRSKVGSIFGRKKKNNDMLVSNSNSSGSDRRAVTQPPDFGLLAGPTGRSSSPVRPPPSSGRHVSAPISEEQSSEPKAKAAPAPPPARHVGSSSSALNSTNGDQYTMNTTASSSPPIPQQSLQRQPSNVGSGHRVGDERQGLFNNGSSASFGRAGDSVPVTPNGTGPNDDSPFYFTQQPQKAAPAPSDLRRSSSRNARASTLFHSVEPSEPEAYAISEPPASRGPPQTQQPPQTPRNGAEEQFFTPAQHFTPVFETGNGSLASIASSSVLHTPHHTEGLPELPAQEGLVASVLETISAELGSTGAVSTVKGSGKVYAGYTGNQPALPNLVVGALGSSVNEFTSAAPYIQQLSSNSFDIPVSRVAHTVSPVMQYSLLDARTSVPIALAPVWGIEPHQARLMLSYGLADTWSGPDTIELQNLVVVVSIQGGHAHAAQSKPVATFSRDRQRVTWRLRDPVILRKGAKPQRLLCQFSTQSSAQPASIDVKFQVPRHVPAVGLQVLESNAWQGVPTASTVAVTLHV